MKTILLSPKDLPLLSIEQKTSFHPFIKEELWGCLEGKDPKGLTNAEIYGAVALGPDDKPVGFALLSYRPNMLWGKLLSFYIQPPFDEDSALLELLKVLEDKLRLLRCDFVTYIYSMNDSMNSQMQRISAQAGWNPPYQQMARLFFNAADFHPIWLEEYRKRPLDEGYQLFLWSALHESERVQLLKQVEESAFPPSVSPFSDESHIEPLNSIGIRYKKQLAGWLITYRTDAETITYGSVFVYPEFRNTNILFALGSHSLALQQESKIPKGIVEINLQQSEHSWVAFVKKRFLPLAHRVERLYEINHNLSGDLR